MNIKNDVTIFDLSKNLNDSESLRLIMNGYDTMELADLLTDEEIIRFCGYADEAFNVSHGEYEKESIIDRIKKAFGCRNNIRFVGEMTFKEFNHTFWKCRNDFAQILGYKDYEDLKNDRVKENAYHG